MSAAEKAKELLWKYLTIREDWKVSDSSLAKKCAIIAVKEIIQALSEYDERTEKYLKEEKGIDFASYETQNMDSSLRYWEQVLKEIKKL